MSVAGRRLARWGGAALTATALTAGLLTPGLAPKASADVDFGAVSTGPLFALAAGVGYDTVVIKDVDVLGNITIHLTYSPAISPVLAGGVDSYPFGGFNPLGSSFKRQPGGTLGAVILGGSGPGAYQAGIAYEALLASAGGNTPPGYPTLVPSGKVNSLTGAACTTGPTCVQGTNITNLAVLMANNPGTPNGGLFARFAPILNLFGVEAISPVGQSASTTGVALNAATIGLSWGYHPFSDFPVSLNPFALANSAMAALLPTNLIGGATLEGDSDSLIYTRLGFLASLNLPSTSYSVFAPADLPLLEPLRLPSRIINAVAGALGLPLNLGTPLADALQPALSILVNTGYTDVQTPTEGGTYIRTYDQSGSFVPFLSQPPLTPAEWLQVPGDVARALVVGFQDAFPVLRFGAPAPVLTVDGNHLAITYPTPPAAAGTAGSVTTAKAKVARNSSTRTVKPAATVTPTKQAGPARSSKARAVAAR